MDAVPNLGESGQAVSNEQLLTEADVLFAVFGARLRMATDEYVSGTAEEIRRAHDAGRQVHVYFWHAGKYSPVERHRSLLSR